MRDNPTLLDLKSVPCPLNLVKCKLALEKISNGEKLYVEIDRGEPEFMVTQSLRKMGYQIQIIHQSETCIKLLVTNEFNQ